ncbi:uncharacterized protein [Drosophila takahashii]|uniref:uncharacterized protein isoform X1 n=1 Tax=Drosophila takahashii TaxID=29030 RepID=UPI001CF818B7|nr:uncharacterized protein LOC108065195 [Drosophila takahashii]
MESQRSITDLPFDVLDLIFKELESLIDKLQLAQAHEKLGKAFSYHSRSAYKCLYPFAGIRPELWMVLVKECGSTIVEFSSNKVESTNWSDQLAKSIVLHCPNMKAVKIHVYEDNCDSVQSFLLNMSNALTSVELVIFTNDSKKIFDSVAKMINITKLILRGDITEEVYQIQKLVALEELEIVSYKRFSPYMPLNLLEICAPLTNLRCLTVLNITIMPSEKQHSMVWTVLAHLKINNCEIFTELPHCPSLKDLDMINTKCHVKGLLLGFILQNGINLEKMNEKGKPPPFDGDGFLQVLRSCPKLRTFYTPMQDIKIYQSYVSSIVEILKENGVQQEEPFRLIIYARPKSKWLRRLIPRTSNPELIALDYLYNF